VRETLRMVVAGRARGTLRDRFRMLATFPRSPSGGGVRSSPDCGATGEDLGVIIDESPGLPVLPFLSFIIFSQQMSSPSLSLSLRPNYLRWPVVVWSLVKKRSISVLRFENRKRR
jgi:hypothetical protein